MADTLCWRLHGISGEREEGGRRGTASRDGVRFRHGKLLTVEKFGLDCLRTLKRPEITARAKHFHKMTQFKL